MDHEAEQVPHKLNPQRMADPHSSLSPTVPFSIWASPSHISVSDATLDHQASTEKAKAGPREQWHLQNIVGNPCLASKVGCAPELASPGYEVPGGVFRAMAANRGEEEFADAPPNMDTEMEAPEAENEEKTEETNEVRSLQVKMKGASPQNFEVHNSYPIGVLKFLTPAGDASDYVAMNYVRVSLASPLLFSALPQSAYLWCEWETGPSLSVSKKDEPWWRFAGRNWPMRWCSRSTASLYGDPNVDAWAMCGCGKHWTSVQDETLPASTTEQDDPRSPHGPGEQAQRTPSPRPAGTHEAPPPSQGQGVVRK